MAHLNAKQRLQMAEMIMTLDTELAYYDLAMAKVIYRRRKQPKCVHFTLILFDFLQSRLALTIAIVAI